MLKVNVTGLDQIVRKLKALGPQVVEETDAVFENIAKEFVERAKMDAPKDVGFLAGQITHKKVKDLNHEITSGSKYAGYLEFGTKKNYLPIAGFEDVATGIRGPGEGTMAEFKDSIGEWINRHGGSITTKDGTVLTGKQAVNYLVWIILKNGIKPQPYFFKQFAQAKKDLERDLKTMAEQLLT